MSLSDPSVRAAFDVRLWGERLFPCVIAGQTDLFCTGLLMLAQHSRGYVTESITCTTGVSAAKSGPGWSLTAGVTAGIAGAARGLALDLAPLRVNCIAPGLVKTEMWSVSHSKPKRGCDLGTDMA
jgi:NAD(P)-dependent dehydrogenase (short-subunit alcohol dehydrogenase family)